MGEEISEVESGQDMKVIRTERRMCECCGQEHEVKIVLVKEESTFKDTPVEYAAVYTYCDAADELYADEQQTKENDIRYIDAYRKANGLLTSEQIQIIRKNYNISQGDLCLLLGWGGKTITRYESHQVQDRAHDFILRKLDQDPAWFLELLDRAKDELIEGHYQKYRLAALEQYKKARDLYLKKYLEACHIAEDATPSPTTP